MFSSFKADVSPSTLGAHSPGLSFSPDASLRFLVVFSDDVFAIAIAIIGFSVLDLDLERQQLSCRDFFVNVLGLRRATDAGQH